MIGKNVRQRIVIFIYTKGCYRPKPRTDIGLGGNALL
jgi:hypothetical protein